MLKTAIICLLLALAWARPDQAAVMSEPEPAPEPEPVPVPMPVPEMVPEPASPSEQLPMMPAEMIVDGGDLAAAGTSFYKSFGIGIGPYRASYYGGHYPYYSYGHGGYPYYNKHHFPYGYNYYNNYHY